MLANSVHAYFKIITNHNATPAIWDIYEFTEIEPCLRILEEPQNIFRFRYISELRATHGCLLGINSTAESRSYPTVELENYDKCALIRCRLVQHQSSDEHPHRLQVDGEEDVAKEVPESDSYRVSFRGMTIVHMTRINIADILYKQCKNENPDVPIDNELWKDCWKKAKEMKENIVRLRFSAHDIETGREICEPVFSEPIRNKKSALKICRMSRLGGHPEGGEEVIMFVERVSSRDIEIHFIERNEAGHEVWFAKADFSTADVHHMFAIAFRTPPYSNQQIFTNVKVSVMLFRPSDDSYSKPIEFSYYADPFARRAKRKAPNPSCSVSTSIESDGSHIPDSSAGGPSSSTTDAEESLNTQTNVQGDTAPELQCSENSIQDLKKLLADIPPLQTEGSTGDFVSSFSSTMDTEETLKTQINIQGDTADLEPQQSDNSIQDFDKFWDFDFTMVDLYNMHEILVDTLQKDSGLGTVQAAETLAPGDPSVKYEPEVHQSTDERVQAAATLALGDPSVKSEPEVHQSTDDRDTCQSDQLHTSDSLERPLSSIISSNSVHIGQKFVVPLHLGDTRRGDMNASNSSDVLGGPKTIFSKAKRFFAMFTCSENILMILFLCFSFVIGIYVY